MHVLGDGILKLRATKTRTDAWASYESAMLRSKVEFRPASGQSYYMAARVRLPNVIGTWPAMWLATGFGSNGQIQWPPEIDIFEGPLNGVEDTASMLHMGAQARGGKQTLSGAKEITFTQSFEPVWGNYTAAQSIRDAWIEIGAQWTDSSVCYFVDGTKTMCENYRWTDDAGVVANPASLLLNLAIGGAWAGRYGVAGTVFPTQLEIDFVRVYGTAPVAAPPPPVASPPGPPAPETVDATGYRIDAGSATAYTAADGRVWDADRNFLVGDGDVVDRGPISVDNSSDARLFQTERWCLDGYNLPIGNGNYLVNLYFAETSPTVGSAGARVFDVAVEGQRLLGLDVFQLTGGRQRATVKTFRDVAVADGVLNIAFTRHADCPMIDAVEVLPMTGAALPTALRLDAGSDSAYLGPDGSLWLADQGFLVGDGGVVDRGPIAIAGTVAPRVFQTERWCPAGYELPIPNGRYTVTLGFAETSPNVTGPGGRVFDVSVEGKALPSIDVFNETGGPDRALNRSMRVNVVDGSLSIAFTKKVECPMVDAIEVQPVGFNPTIAVVK